MGCLLACIAAAVLIGSSPDSASLEEFVSWALRPDGSAAVYVLQRERRADARILYQDLTSGAKTELHAQIPQSARASDIRPQWSPDGSQLAYFLPVNAVWRLHVWRPADGSHRVFLDREACVSSNECNRGRLEWSADNRHIYFLARPQNAERLESSDEPTPAVPSWRQILFADPDNDGVTVLESPETEAEEASQSRLVPDRELADAVVADTRTGALRSVLAGKNLVRIAVSPNGKLLLAVAKTGTDSNVRQEYSDYYVVPLDAKPEKHSGIQPMLRDVRQTWPAAWSADSRSVAFIENGPLASGDIHLLDVRTGRARNITDGLVLAENGEQLTALPEANRHRSAPGEKFGGAQSLLWSTRSDALYVLRRTRFADGWRTRLWRVSVQGQATNLSAGLPFDVGLPLAGKTGLSNSDDLIVPTRLTTGEAGFAAISQSERQIKELQRIAGDFQNGWQGDFSEAQDRALFVSEAPDAPPEAFVLRLSDGSIAPVTGLNEALAGRENQSALHRVTWQTPDGSNRYGFLYSRGGSRPHAPLIVDIYPREPFTLPLSGTAYLGRSNLFNPPLAELLQSGYALFKPDIPVAGNGNTCDSVALDLTLALDAIENLRLADTHRSVLFGVSFGGWAVSCAITRMNRFEAAISVAGPSDLFSTRFSIVGSVATWGIGGGQTMIGQDIWDAPDLYWRESPLSGARNVSTPLLLIHGKMDQRVPVSQAAEMYTALMRAGKRVTLVTYDDTAHAAVLAHPDYAGRVKSWIHEHVPPDCPVSALIEGVARKGAGDHLQACR